MDAYNLDGIGVIQAQMTVGGNLIYELRNPPLPIPGHTGGTSSANPRGPKTASSNRTHMVTTGHGTTTGSIGRWPKD